MVIESVNAYNLEEYLYDIIKKDRLENNTSEARRYRSKINSVLNRMMISIELSDVKMMEVLFLKSFASSLTVKNIKRADNLGLVDHADLESLYMSMNTIINGIAEDNNGIDLSGYAVPTSAVLYDVYVNFTGIALNNIIGEFISMNVDKIGYMDDKLDYNKIMANIKSTFADRFLKFMMDKLSESDTLTDFTMMSTVFNGSKQVRLLEAKTPAGLVNFIGKKGSERLYALDASKKIFSNSMCLKHEIYQATKLSFSVTTSLASLVSLMTKSSYVNYDNIEPIGLITSGMDVKFPSISLVKYKQRIKDIYGEYQKARRDKIKKGGLNIFQIYDTLPANVDIKYIVEIPLSDALDLHDTSWGDISLNYNRAENIELMDIAKEIQSLAEVVKKGLY